MKGPTYERGKTEGWERFRFSFLCVCVFLFWTSNDFTPNYDLVWGVYKGNIWENITQQNQVPTQLSQNKATHVPSKIVRHYVSFKDWDDILVMEDWTCPWPVETPGTSPSFLCGQLVIEIHRWRLKDKDSPCWANLGSIKNLCEKRDELITYQLVSWIYSSYSIKSITWKSRRAIFGELPHLRHEDCVFLFMSPGRKVAKIRWHGKKMFYNKGPS